MQLRFLPLGALLSICLIEWAGAIIIPNGTLDNTFLPGAISNGDVLAVVEQPDGKVLIGGRFAKLNGDTHLNIGRLNADGSVDTSFTAATDPGAQISSIVLQPDGKIVLVGTFSTVNGVERDAGIARLNANGTLDTSFNPGRVISIDGADDGSGNATYFGSVSTVILQSSGRVVVFGAFSYIVTGPGTSVARSGVAAFTSAGAFDATFNPGAGFNYTVDPAMASANYAVAQSTGNIVVAGTFDRFDGNTVPGIVRLTATGAYDGTFKAGSAAPLSSGIALFRQSDDKIIVFGNFTAFNGTARNGLARLGANGALDSTFVPGLLKDYADVRTATDVRQQSTGKLIVVGPFHSYAGNAANGMVRLNTDGSFDSTFASASAVGPNGYGESAFVRSDDRIFVGGYFSSFGGFNANNITRTTANGDFDPVFTPFGASDGTPQIFASGVQSSGAIIIGGTFSSFDGNSHYNLVRLLPDGSLDSSFAIGSGLSRSVRALIVLPNDKILIAGQFGAVNGAQQMRVVLLNADGSVDYSLNPGTGPDDIVYAMTRDGAGNIYLGGAFKSVNGTARANLVKLSPTGAVDPTFNPGSGTDQDVRVLAPPNGSAGVIIGGAFSIYNGAAVPRLARVDASTGALDTAFKTAGGSGPSSTVRVANLLSTGAYIIGGSFTQFNAISRSRLARLNSDGSLDSTFVPPSFNASVYSLLSVGSRTFVGGAFLSPTAGLARVLVSGALDSSFSGGSGITLTPPDAISLFPAQAETISQQPDGKLIVGGLFTKYNGTARASLVRITGPALTLSLLRLPNLHLRLSGTGEPSTSYTLLGTRTLSAAFGAIGEITTDANGNFQYEDAVNSGFPAYFYELTPE